MPENIGKIRVYAATVINSVELSARQRCVFKYIDICHAT